MFKFSTGNRRILGRLLLAITFVALSISAPAVQPVPASSTASVTNWPPPPGLPAGY